MDKQQFKKSINQSRLPELEKDRLLSYVDKLYRNEVPVVYSMNHFASILGIRKTILYRMVRSGKSFYRTFTIPKRRGGTRELSAPYPLLLEVQRWINENLLNKIPVESSAHGFVKGRSIVTNAGTHLNAEYLLKMDIKNFFPSIPIARVISIFQILGYPHYISFMLASLCCLHGKLPQGSATSPTISNIVTKRMDRRLVALSKKYELSYSRYADDLTFSGKHISVKFIQIVREVVEGERFEVNQSKTRLVRGTGKKIVTGISVNGRKLSLPRETKRALRKEAHYLTKYGYFDHLARIGSTDPMYVERLMGKLTFWRQIEPDNVFVGRAIERVRKIQVGLDVI